MVKTFTYLDTPGSTWDLSSLTREHGHWGCALCISSLQPLDLQGHPRQNIFYVKYYIYWIEFFSPHFEMWQFKAKKNTENKQTYKNTHPQYLKWVLKMFNERPLTYLNIFVCILLKELQWVKKWLFLII